jgi:dTDP-4-dehydrorhamnose 3,5-epimerase-like enzyme
MDMGITFEKVDAHHDERGMVFEPLLPSMMAVQRNVHAVLTNPGCTRGNHYHNRGTEIITLYGPALARFRENQQVQEYTIHNNQTVRFIIPRGVSHAFKNIGDRTTCMIAFNSEARNEQEPDIIRDVLIEN